MLNADDSRMRAQIAIRGPGNPFCAILRPALSRLEAHHQHVPEDQELERRVVSTTTQCFVKLGGCVVSTPRVPKDESGVKI